MFCSSLRFLFHHLSLSFYYSVEKKRLLTHRCGNMRFCLFYEIIKKYQIGGIWYNGGIKSSGNSDFGGWERVMFHHMGIMMSVVFKEGTNRWCFGALSEIASGLSKELKSSVIAHVPVNSALSYPAALLLSMRRFCVRMKHALLVGR